MSVASMVIEVRGDTGEAVMNSLAGVANLTVYGIKDNKIVAVIENDDIVSAEDTIKTILEIQDVIGAYPVYIGTDD